MTTERRRRRGRAEPIGVSALVRRWQRKAPAAPGSDLAAVRAAWSEVAGAIVAARSLPLRRSRAGVLTVGCADAGWVQELTSRRDLLLERLAHRVPEAGLTGLRFAVADYALSALAQDAPPAPPTPPTAAEHARAEALVAGASDLALRSLLERAAARSIQRDEQASRTGHRTRPTSRQESALERPARWVPVAGRAGARAAVSDRAPSAASEEGPLPAPTAEERARAEALVAQVAHPVLRRLLEHGAVSSIQRASALRVGGVGAGSRQGLAVERRVRRMGEAGAPAPRLETTVRQSSAPPQDAPAPAPPAPPTAQERARARALVAEVADSALRDLLERAAARSIQTAEQESPAKRGINHG